MKNGCYELVKAPPEYPGKKYRGKYVYEHHLVWWQKTGLIVPVGFVIHHINEQQRDNRFENLQLKEDGEHKGHHSKERGHGNVVLTCKWCGCEFERGWNKRAGKFCCTSHQVLQQHKDRRHSRMGER